MSMKSLYTHLNTDQSYIEYIIYNNILLRNHVLLLCQFFQSKLGSRYTCSDQIWISSSKQGFSVVCLYEEESVCVTLTAFI